MHPFTTEDISLEVPPRSLWRALRDLAISVAVVGAIALIATFLGATSAHAHSRNALRTATTQQLLEGRFFFPAADSNSKEPSVSIQAINVRNQFKGKVREIIRGDVVSEVDVETAWGIVTSVITTRSVDELQLKVGSDVVALVKSTEVSIAKL